MIQFNLLPDVKIEFIRTRTRKRMIMLIAGIASAAALGIFILLFLFVRVNQTKHIGDLTKDIDTNVKKIQEVEDLDKILTIQNQLNSLDGLHDKKIISSRVVDYMNRLTPSQATISAIELDYTTNTLKINGNGDRLLTVNKFVDTMKFTEYKVNNDAGSSGMAFKDVVLAGFSVSAGGQSTSYQITATFDPLIFSKVKDVTEGATEPVTLTVPAITSTRSETEKPDSLFTTQQGSEGQR